MPLANFLVFLFGLSIGSFLNSIVLRFNTGETVTKGRSRCFNCGRILTWHELLPVVSFVVQKGRCRNCSSKLSWQYPLGEILAGILFLILFVQWSEKYLGHPWILAFWFVIFSILIMISLYDLRHKIIPDSFSYSLLALAVIYQLIFFKINLLNLILSLTPALFLFSLWLFSSGRWMGLGDAKLMMGAGILLGFPGSIYATMFGFWIGALVGISLLLASGKTTLKSEIPFGPFLVFGIFLAFFLADILASLNFLYA